MAAVIGFIISWSPTKRLVWKLDRGFNLKEQVSTAWSVPQTELATLLAPALQQDVLALLPGVRRRILLRGWNSLGEVISLLVVLVLGAAVYMGSVPASPLGRLSAAPAAQAPAFQAQEPARADVLPKGILSLDNQAKTDSTQPGAQGQAVPTPAAPPQAGDLASMSQTLQQVGQQLSQQAASYELGQALQKQDFQKAADQLEQVADKLGSLSPDTRSQLASAMAQAAQALKDQKPAEQMAADLSQAADALKTDPASGSQQAGQSSPRDAMDKVANDLRDLSAQAAGAEAGQPQSGTASGSGADAGSGMGTGSGASLSGGGAKQGTPASLTRLEGQSGDFKLDINDPSLAGILVPGPTNGTGTTTAGGAANQTGPTSGETNQSVLFPYSYDWKWQGLIAQYFQRGQ